MMGLRTFSKGVHPPTFKDLTRSSPIRRLGFAPLLAVSLAGHLGRPSRPMVRIGEEVERGQKIAEADGFLSVAQHAPASGQVTKIDQVLDAQGHWQPAVFIEPFAASQQILPVHQLVDSQHLDLEQLIHWSQEIGMVGLGGAAFPTHVKIASAREGAIHSLIVNGAECEPYLSADHRVMLEQSADVVAGIRLLQRCLGAQRVLVAVEDNKSDALAQLRQTAGEGTGWEWVPLKTKYPQGAEKLLVRVLLGQDLPSGFLPKDLGVLVANVTTLAEMGLLLPIGAGIVERVVTVAGDACLNPGNYLVPLGTPLGYILDQLGEKPELVVLGGPMMGRPVASGQTVTTKGVTGILMFKGLQRPTGGPDPCISCGKCLSACPLDLNPSRLGKLAQAGAWAEMQGKQHLFDCFECGACAYVCPSRIPLPQLFRAAKAALRKENAS
ncbi:MAG: electron transport complex subunit RsxC [bacterium]|nr:electron transport complex subunit RsxC [bacterium]